MHYPSEACQDFILSSRAEDGVSAQQAASQPNQCPSASEDAEHADTAVQPFWEVRQATAKLEHANSDHGSLVGIRTHLFHRWFAHDPDRD